ncbi:MAG TPA: DUF3592 domain-containing protein [Candidatus Tenderia electrophaga]|uniref:DUF3592 domain-containing protein n=1 Tax=Candidatus Tenderia electrophaga TaxID=1748243 RepID=A0A832J659_9GAMM|nr:DUF3592 domain-containing protein [Candidatus Tenderia electrophaga]
MNPYFIMLTLVIVGGIGITAWGWQVLRKSHKVKQWPSVEGVIEESELSSEQDDLLPHIAYRYDVNGQTLRCVFEFPNGTQPLPEFAQAYVKKYPVGAKVQVFYDPQQMQHSTLEPGSQGDWMILVVGVFMALGGAIALLI